MSNPELAAEDPAKSPGKERSWITRKRCRLCLYVLVPLFLLAGSAFLLRGAILNGFAKEHLEEAFAKANPGYTLKLGVLEYGFRSRDLLCSSAQIRGPELDARIGQITIRDADWLALITGRGSAWMALRNSSFDGRSADGRFGRYTARVDLMRGSFKDGSARIDRMELRPIEEPEAFFAAEQVRSTRYTLRVGSFTVTGLDYKSLMEGTGYAAAAVRVSAPEFDAYVNRDKPKKPMLKPPPTLQEVLASVPDPLRIGQLNISEGRITYRERVVKGRQPGVLTFDAVQLRATNITNAKRSGQSMTIEAGASLMGASPMKLTFDFPTDAKGVSFRYHGSLGTMDMTRLNPFLELAENTRVKSGRTDGVKFAITVKNGHASGQVQAKYKDLKIEMMKKDQPGDTRQVVSFLANAIKVRDANTAAEVQTNPGRVEYPKQTGDKFIQFLWVALRIGILDLITH